MVFLFLFFSYGPRYLARYLVAAELDELGIDYAGVDTLRINPWMGELWLGPIRFGAGPSGPGQMGELGLSIDFNPLLEHRFSIERLLVRGIDVVVTHSKDNALALNGIPLNQFILPPETGEQPAAGDDSWGAGVETFELRDSRLIFQGSGGGDLEVDVKRLQLADFLTWKPEQPGHFELAAEVNGIQLNWSGEARPFADNITLDIDSRTENADVPKLVRFTGPWGLDRRDGTYGALLRYEVTLFESGRLEGRTIGSIDIKGADYERAGRFALMIEQAKVNLDVRYILSESGDFELQGEVETDLGHSSGTLTDNTHLAAATGRISLSELDIAYAKNGTLRFDMQPNIDLGSTAFSGPIEISMDKLLQLLMLLQSLSTATTVSTTDTGLGDFSDQSVIVPRSDIKVGRLKSRGDSFSLQSAKGQVELHWKSSTDLFDIQIGTKERSTDIERLQSVVERLSVTSGQGRLAVEMAGNSSLAAGTIKGPLGELTTDSLATDIGKLGLQAQTGAVSMQLAATSQVKGFSSLIYANQAQPEVQINLGTASATLKQASLDARGDASRWRAAGEVAADSLAVDFAKGMEGAIKFSRAEAKGLQANERLQLAADAMTIDGLDLYVKRSLIEALLGEEEMGAQKTASSEGVMVKSSVTALNSEAQELDVGRGQTLLTELGYAPSSADGRQGQPKSTAVRELQRNEGPVDDGRLTAGLLDILQARAAGPAVDDAGTLSASVRLGKLALTGKSVIHFRDDIVTPHVIVHTVFKEAQMHNLDTLKSHQRTDFHVAADVNQFTKVELNGWVNGIGKDADFDINTKAKNLQLSTYSPYIAELAGVYPESGQLDATTTGKVVQGDLQGEIQFKLNQMAFRPLSEEDAERVTSALGVPLEMAVGLLQDTKGRIALTLPVSGTLNEPDVDISSALNKAFGGVMKKVFPPTLIASLVSGAEKRTSSLFKPIEFTPGSAKFGGAGKRYADRIVELLSERPKLSLKVCGRSTAQDMKQLMTTDRSLVPSTGAGKPHAGQSESRLVLRSAQVEQALAELATERTQVVRDYLIKEKGADVKRVSECRATFEATDQGTPRVEISL